jgi:hypothetical protein
MCIYSITTQAAIAALFRVVSFSDYPASAMRNVAESPTS